MVLLATEHDSAFLWGHIATHDIKVLQELAAIMAKISKLDFLSVKGQLLIRNAPAC
jgi:hypothetical protein